MAPALAAYGGNCEQRISFSVALERNKAIVRTCRNDRFLEGGGLFAGQNIAGLCAGNNLRHASRSGNGFFKAPLRIFQSPARNN